MTRHPEALRMSRVRIMCIPRYCILAECVCARFSKFKIINIYIDIPKSLPFGYVWCFLPWISRCPLAQNETAVTEKILVDLLNSEVTEILVVVSPNSSPGPTLKKLKSSRGQYMWKVKVKKKHLKCPSRYEASNLKTHYHKLATVMSAVSSQ